MSIARTICLGFVGAIALGTLLLLLPFATTSSNTGHNPLIALFTATSAICVTGLAVVDTGTHFSFWGQLTILLLIQIGGLGYMTLTTFLMLLLGRRFDLRQKFAIQESFDRPFLLGSQNLIRSIFATTLICEITGIFCLIKPFAQDYGLSQGLWFAMFHSISAWNNAGFSLFSDSLVGYQASGRINLVIPALVIFGGLGYQAIIELYLWLVNFFNRSKVRFCFSLNFKVVTSTTIFLLLTGTIAFFLTEMKNPATLANLNLPSKILAAWFQSITTRTAGFNTIDIGQMTTAGLFITMGLMFIGASPAGTAGGIKTTTLRILSNCTASVLQGKDDIILYQRKVPKALLLKAVAVVFGSIATITLATICIAIADGDLDLIAILFEVISAFSTAGLSTGITASLSSFSQLVLIFTMYSGRVGILLLIAAIIKESSPRVIQYPEDNLLVG